MRREMLSLALGAALALTLTACTSGTAPDVTPTPTMPVPTQQPMTTDDAHYDADREGKVEGTLTPEGSMTNNAIHKAENGVRRAADDVARGVEKAMY